MTLDQTDILFLQVDQAKAGRTPQAVDLAFGDTLQVTAGIQKAAQSFLALLLTKQGEAWNQDLGCDFLAALEQGKVRTEVDAQNYFALGVPELLQQVNSQAVYDDETLVSAVLTGVTVERTKLTLRITLTNAAGSSTLLLAPL